MEEEKLSELSGLNNKVDGTQKGEETTTEEINFGNGERPLKKLKVDLLNEAQESKSDNTTQSEEKEGNEPQKKVRLSKAQKRQLKEQRKKEHWKEVRMKKKQEKAEQRAKKKEENANKSSQIKDDSSQPKTNQETKSVKKEPPSCTVLFDAEYDEHMNEKVMKIILDLLSQCGIRKFEVWGLNFVDQLGVIQEAPNLFIYI